MPLEIEELKNEQLNAFTNEFEKALSSSTPEAIKNFKETFQLRYKQFENIPLNNECPSVSEIFDIKVSDVVQNDTFRDTLNLIQFFYELAVPLYQKYSNKISNLTLHEYLMDYMKSLKKLIDSRL